VRAFSTVRAWIAALVARREVYCAGGGDVGIAEGLVTVDLVRDAEARRQRHAELFAVHVRLDRVITEIYNANREKLRAETQPEEVCAFLFGKATKTLRAVRLLCEGGFGQDAVILTRSLANLVINLWYIGGDPEERTKDYIANGRKALRTFQEFFPDRPRPLPPLDADWEKVKEGAKRWKDVSIEMRAKGTPLEDTYHELYRHGSSLDHSDAWSANQYVGPREGETFSINNGPSDDLVGIALGYALQAMIILMMVVCRAFDITERERLDGLLAEFKALKSFKPEPSI
jgi:hypothetical protein